MVIYFGDNNQSLIDTIHLNKNGNFYLKTFKVKNPQKTSIRQNTIQINNLFVAPGYNLTITANGSDYLSLLKTKKITGIGSESNSYSFLLDSILVSRMDRTKYFELNESEFLAYSKKSLQLKDSVANIVFKSRVSNDKYFNYFGKVVRLDNNFTNLSTLLTYVNLHSYSYENAVAFVKNNFSKGLSDNLFKDEYLISENYKEVIRGQYLNYLMTLDCLKDSSLYNKKHYNLEVVNKVYKSKAKEYTLFELMTSYIFFCHSFEDLNECKRQFETYISVLAESSDKEAIYTIIAQKETELLKTQIGKPAPTFTLEDNMGNIHRLSDFKGKVVYLDLWASWCSPCRAEIPSFKILQEKYKTNEQITFVSISVQDGVREWKKALEEDKPFGVQLIDKDGIVWKSYVANSIPRYILIDKRGDIVNFDAPKPSSAKKIETLLNQEIAK